MNNRTLGIVKRLSATVAIIAAWLSVSRLIAVWLANRSELINGPVRRIYADDTSCYITSYRSHEDCTVIGYQYGSGIYPEAESNMPTSSFFGTVYTDGWGFVITHFLGAIALFIGFVLLGLLFLLIDGIINGFSSSSSDPCDHGQCGCNCNCCQRRKKRHDDAQRSNNTALAVATGVAVGVAIGS